MIQFVILTLAMALNFSKADFYKAMEKSNSEEVFSLLKKASNPSSDDQKAYYGAIQMKAAEFYTMPNEKLSSFKDGKTLLEATINKNPQSVEYRFLRLLIQENAPKFLGYNKNISSDAQFIKSNYTNAESDVKNAIISYAKKSEALKL